LGWRIGSRASLTRRGALTCSRRARSTCCSPSTAIGSSATRTSPGATRSAKAAHRSPEPARPGAPARRPRGSLRRARDGGASLRAAEELASGLRFNHCRPREKPTGDWGARDRRHRLRHVEVREELEKRLVLGARTGPQHLAGGRDDPKSVVVGDSVWDLLAARRARALGIGLLSGGYGHEELISAGAYRVYDHPRDLLDHLDEVGVRRPL
jgi:hypothetical protein